VEGVLVLRDYHRIRPDLVPKGKGEGRGDGEDGAGGEETGPTWGELGEDEVARRMGEMYTELEEQHVQFHMDGLRNVWIVKPGHGTRGQGIKCYDSLKDILSLASKRGGGKKSVVVRSSLSLSLSLSHTHTHALSLSRTHSLSKTLRSTVGAKVRRAHLKP
jgi:hypothetical protein